MSEQIQEATTEPVLSVTRGNPTPEELAAVVAVVQSLASQGELRPHQPDVGTVGGGWKSYWRVVRQPLHPGNEAWRTTLRI